MLLATGLMRVFGFGSGEAAAWLRMVCPPLHVPHAQLSAAVAQGRTSAVFATDELDCAVGRTASAPVHADSAIRRPRSTAPSPFTRTLSMPAPARYLSSRSA